ncbi:MAG: coenzyme-B sulfoethylthiotransferase subunit beta, partial [Candidatus Nezhaarchaeales archaeon]
MSKFPDKVDLYDDRGNLIDSKVPLDALSPLVNPAIKKIISIIKRAVAVNLRGIERALATGAVGGRGCVIRGRELKLDVVTNAQAIADKLEKLIRVKPDDDTEIKILRNGENLLVMVPSLRLEAG